VPKRIHTHARERRESADQSDLDSSCVYDSEGSLAPIPALGAWSWSIAKIRKQAQPAHMFTRTLARDEQADLPMTIFCGRALPQLRIQRGDYSSLSYVINVCMKLLDQVSVVEEEE
jgi:hypothetical protein